MALKYPKSVAAAREHESSSLALADALAAECKNDKSVREAHMEMIEQGITTLSERRCQELRVVGTNFPNATRRALNRNVVNGLPVGVFQAAGSPKTLEKILDKVPNGEDITVSFVKEQARKINGIPARGESKPRDATVVESEIDLMSAADEVIASLNGLSGLVEDKDLGQEITDYIVDRMITAAKLARSIQDSVQKTKTEKRSHLAVVA